MYKNILVPVVLDQGHDTQGSYLAARALADQDARFTVIHVMETIPGYVESQIPSEVLAESRASIEQALRQSAKALPGAQMALVSGHAGQAILAYARDHDCDCIIIASHKPGLEDLFLGSTAARVVRHAHCAVHVIR